MPTVVIIFSRNMSLSEWRDHDNDHRSASSPVVHPLLLRCYQIITPTMSAMTYQFWLFPIYFELKKKNKQIKTTSNPTFMDCTTFFVKSRKVIGWKKSERKWGDYNLNFHLKYTAILAICQGLICTTYGL